MEPTRMPDDFQNVADIFKQLSDSSRLQIYWFLCHYEECVINISAKFSMSSPAVSHHLRLLKSSGLIIGRRVGKEVYYKAAETQTTRELHRAIEKMMEIHCPAESEDNSLIESVKKIHEKLTTNLSIRYTIEELSADYLMNTTTLKNTFKKLYGLPIASYMKKYRVSTAAARLRTSNASVAAIASEVGYESQGKFTKAFKDLMGLSPSDYRKQYH